MDKEKAKEHIATPMASNRIKAEWKVKRPALKQPKVRTNQDEIKQTLESWNAKNKHAAKAKRASQNKQKGQAGVPSSDFPEGQAGQIKATIAKAEKKRPVKKEARPVVRPVRGKSGKKGIISAAGPNKAGIPLKGESDKEEKISAAKPNKEGLSQENSQPSLRQAKLEKNKKQKSALPKERKEKALPDIAGDKAEQEEDKAVGNNEKAPLNRQSEKKNPEVKVVKGKMTTFIIENARKILFFSLVLLVLLSLIFAPAFRLQKIEHTELFFEKFSKVLEVSQIQTGQHFLQGFGGSLNALLTGSYGKARQRVKEAFPQFKEVEIRYRFPGTVLFEIKERVPVAFIDVDDVYATIDRFGVVCGTYYSVPKSLPAIKGIQAVKMKIGEEIKTNADDALKACVAVMSSLVEADFESQGSSLSLLSQTKEIRSSGYQRILLTFEPDNSGEELLVSCTSTDNLKNDFLWLKRILDSGILKDKLPGTLDVYGSQIVFRPAEKDSSETMTWDAP